MGDFYSDIDSQLAKQSQPTQQGATDSGPDFFSDLDPPKPPGTLYDTATGITKGVEDFGSTVMGAPRDIADVLTGPGLDATHWAANKVRGWLGVNPLPDITPEQRAMAKKGADLLSPGVGREEWRKRSESVTGPIPDPQTEAGKAARTVTGAFLQAPIMGGVLPAIGSGLGEYVGDRTTKGTPYEGYGGPIGSLAGGIGGFLGQGAVRGVEGLVRPALGNAEQQAGEQILTAAQRDIPDLKPSQLIQQIEKAPEYVPGSVPTLGQATGNRGILSGEKVAAAADPVPFANRIGEQNAARVGQLDSILSQTDQATQQKLDAALDNIRQIGATQPEDVGKALRDALSEAYESSQQATRALWKSIDPEGTMEVSVAPLAQATSDVYGNLSRTAAEYVTPAEKKMVGLIAGYEPQMPLREVLDLRAQLNAEMMAERVANGKSPALARMTQLRGATEKTISDTIAAPAAAKADALASGNVANDRLAAKVGTRNPVETASPISGGQGAGMGPAATAGVPPVAGAGLGEVAGQRSGLGVQGLSGNVPARAPGQAITPAAAQKLKDATAATRVEKETFTRGPMSPVLASGPLKGSFKSLDSSVPNAVWKAGDKGGETVQRYLAATKGVAGAEDALRAAASASLSKAAMVNGTLDAAKLAGWRKNYASALSALPGFTEKTVAPLQKQAIAEYIKNTFLSAQESGGVEKLNFSAFWKYMRKNEATLKAAGFTDEQFKSLKAIAVDMQRANRTFTALKVDANSDTAGKILPHLEKMIGGHGGGSQSVLTAAMVGAHLGHEYAGVPGAILGAASAPITKWIVGRIASGQAHIDSLVTEAMLNPQKAKILLQKVPADYGQQEKLLNRLGRAFPSMVITPQMQPSGGQ